MLQFSGKTNTLGTVPIVKSIFEEYLFAGYYVESGLKVVLLLTLEVEYLIRAVISLRSLDK